MPKKKKAEEPEKDNAERWLLTYSDMITLLLTLFILLYSMSNVDAAKFKKVSQYLAYAFNNGKATMKEGGAGSDIGLGNGSAGLTSEWLANLASSKNAASQSSSSSDSGGNGEGDSKAAIDQVYQALSNYVTQNHLQDEISLENTETYVAVRLKGVLMFEPNSWTMLDTSKPVLDNIEKAVAKVYDRVDHITISGHTADDGIHTASANLFSWQLSGERARVVTQYFISKGLNGAKLTYAGCSDFHPVALNNTEAGREKNRRVEITITKYPASSSSGASSKSSSASSSSAASSKSSSQGTSAQAASR